MLPENLNHTINFWIEALEQFSFKQLCTKPAPGSWSMGQLYLHRINDTNYYIEQVKVCLTTNDHSNEEASAFAKMLFVNNSFLDVEIEGNPSNTLIPQPVSKKQLEDDLRKINTEIKVLSTMISSSQFNGKTKHPGLHYFSAAEWLQFADIHFRHHLWQKKRLEDFLKMTT
jgi:hypothetical protein